MSSSENQNKPQLPNKVIDLLVSDILRKNDINPEQVKKNITKEQKEMLRELVQDLSQQVDQFVKQNENAQEFTEKQKKKSDKKIRFKK